MRKDGREKGEELREENDAHEGGPVNKLSTVVEYVVHNDGNDICSFGYVRHQ
ncbi:MAG: hypothetical protein OEZ48_13530 [Candidatus Bathyarchaeota archaeon]|nr:hypothetical protein [Candidatus Bathyarchaeota archaeon]